MTAPRQLVLEIAPPPAFGAEDFLVALSNEAAWRMIEAWPDWPDRTLVLVGPAGSGKSHLAAIWSGRADAVSLAGRGLARADLGSLAGRHILVEEAGDSADESVLFHLINLVNESRSTLLLTDRRPPAAWGLALRDLQSRLRRAMRVDLGSPDDDLMRAVLVKLLVERQLVVDTDIVEFVARRLDRSLGAAREFVRQIDSEALARGRRIGRTLAGDVLRRLDAGRIEEATG
jgi:chromosomal replication initiation ATPase DnaA